MSGHSMKHAHARGASRQCGLIADPVCMGMVCAPSWRAVEGFVPGATVMVGSHFRARAGTQKPGPARAVVAMPGVKRHRAEPSLLEIVFYKEILDHFGFPHRCELMRVPIPQTGPDMAILDAIRQFEREKRVSDWRIAADGYDVVSALTRER